MVRVQAHTLDNQIYCTVREVTPLTSPQGSLTGVKLGARKYTGQGVHSLHCVYRDRMLTFSHIMYRKNIWEPRDDSVIMESALYKIGRYNGITVNVFIRYSFDMIRIKDKISISLYTTFL